MGRLLLTAGECYTLPAKNTGRLEGQEAMGTHTSELSGVTADLLELLDARAREAGASREEYLLRLLRAHLERSDGGAGTESPPAARSLEEILAPVRQRVAQSGLTDAEVDELLAETREEARRERRQVRPQ